MAAPVPAPLPVPVPVPAPLPAVPEAGAALDVAVLPLAALPLAALAVDALSLLPKDAAALSATCSTVSRCCPELPATGEDGGVTRGDECCVKIKIQNKYTCIKAYTSIVEPAMRESRTVLGVRLL